MIRETVKTKWETTMNTSRTDIETTNEKVIIFTACQYALSVISSIDHNILSKGGPLNVSTKIHQYLDQMLEKRERLNARAEQLQGTVVYRQRRFITATIGAVTAIGQLAISNYKAYADYRRGQKLQAAIKI
jgi:hypothetical protein